MTKLLTDWRKRTYGRALLIGLVVSSVFAPFWPSLTSQSDEGLGGDFTAFYGAGMLANEGDYELLYTEDAQLAAQTEGTPMENGRFLYFSYPPAVAMTYGVLASMPYVQAYAIHLAFMFAALLGAIAIGGTLLPKIKASPEQSLLIALGFWPMRQVIVGGSNTAFTLFLLVVIWRLLESEKDVYAGLVASLLLFKPTFGLPFLAVLFVSRRWRALGGGAAGGAVYFVVNSALAGVGWVIPWWDQAQRFGEKDAIINGPAASSILGFAQNFSKAEWTWYTILAAVLLVVVWLGTAWVWSRPNVDLATLMSVFAVASIWGSAHAMSHEIAVLLLPVAVLVQRARQPVGHWLFVMDVTSWFGLAMIALGWAPMFFMGIIIGILVLRELPLWMSGEHANDAELVSSA
jgi:glycosyl transferase family 87